MKNRRTPEEEGKSLLLPNQVRQDAKIVSQLNHPVRRRPDIHVEGETGKLVERRSGFDPVFFILVLVLMLFGSVMVFSASYADALARFGDSFYFAKRQMVFVFLGLIIMPLVSAIPYKFFFNTAYILYAVSLGLLGAVLVYGFASGGAQRWFEIFGISVQPSEIAKVTLVIALARYMSLNKDKIIAYRRNAALHGLENRKLRKKNSRDSFVYGVLFPFLFIGGIDVLVLLEKHISGLVIITLIGGLVMFYSGSRVRDLLPIVILGVSVVVLLIVLFPYASRRVAVWLNPYEYKLDGGWQTIQGLYAIGSGGPFGLGLGQSRLKYSYVSQPHNDFIFTIVCEELGFIGACALILLFGLLVWRGILISRRAPDAFASIVAFGISAHLAIQVLLNIAVVTNSIPNTGIALPFFSYGGSSLIVLAAEMGIMLSISRASYIRK